MTAYRNKGTISEDDVYSLVLRYGASSIFSLIHEISQATEKDVTIDWRALVKSTSTGISNAREYQMLWRHLAYRDPLEKLEDWGEPLSDESDLEFELEATPASSKEVSTEMDCCVKVLLSSGVVGHCTPVATLVEAPPTANDQSSVVPPDKPHLNRHHRSTNGAALPAQKQQLSAGLSADGLDGNDLPKSACPAKKKRKQWKQEEDMELIAAVEKFGEGNWANILKGDFKHDRTASQLSQRWATIRKRQDSNLSTIVELRSEELLAANKAFSMAINMPLPPSLSTIHSAGTQMQTAKSSPTMAKGTTGVIDESQDATSHAFKKNHQPPNQESSSHKGVPTVSKKPRVSQKKQQAQVKPSSICPNPLIKAAAFAAGGRIATPSTAATLFKAAQSKNAVRIRHGGATPFAGPPVTTAAATSTTIPSPSSASTAPVSTAPGTAVVGLPHVINPRFSHPSASKLGQSQGSASKAPCLPPSAVMQNLPAERRRLPGIIISDGDFEEFLAGEGRGTQGKDISVSPAAEAGNSLRIRRETVNESQDMEVEESSEVKKASSPETTRV